MSSDDREPQHAQDEHRLRTCDICADVDMRPLHALATAVAEDDLDTAIALGLLEYRGLAVRQNLEQHASDGDVIGGDVIGGDAIGGDAIGGDAIGGDAIDRGAFDLAGLCEACRMWDRSIVLARDARLRALAARERFRARETRLRLRAQEHARRREAAALATVLAHAPEAQFTTPALPPAAAAALARAKAKAAARAAKE